MNLPKIGLLIVLFCSKSALAGGGSPAEYTPPVENDSVAAIAYDGCTAYDIVTGAPDFLGPSEQGFRHTASSLSSNLYTPQHMIYDELVNAGESTVVTGKFDYDLVLHKDLEDEYIHAYIFGTGMTTWDYLGRYTTDSDGQVFVNVAGRPTGDYIVRMVAEGDQSQVDGYLSVREQNRQAVIFDIDGTLTLSDAEQIGDYVGTSTAQAFYFARETVQAYREKGYQLVFLTARPYWMAKGSREWLRNEMQQSDWHLRLNADGEIPSSFGGHAEYKRDYINKLKSEGLDIVRAYGNASTDIEAYEEAGIPKSETYIIGDNAGDEGTQDVGSDYSQHFLNVVQNTPNAACK